MLYHTYTRKIEDEPQAMIDAANNKKRVLGSTIFGGDTEYYVGADRRNQPSIQDQKTQASSYANSPPKPVNAIPRRVETTPPPQITPIQSSYPQPDWSLFQGEMNAATLPNPVSLEFNVHGSPLHTSDRRLQVGPNLQMVQLREELNRETRQFAERVKKIGN